MAKRNGLNCSGDVTNSGSDWIALIGNPNLVPTGSVRPSENVNGLDTTVREQVTCP